MIAPLHTDNVMSTRLLEIANMRGIRGQSILNNDDRQAGMFLAEQLQPATGSISFAIIFLISIGLDNRLGAQGKYFPMIGMHQRRTEHVMRIGDGAVAMILDQTRLAVNLRGGKVAGTVERDEVMAPEVGVVFEYFPALQTAENVGEGGAEMDGVEGIEDRSHLRIAGNLFDAIDGSEVVIGSITSLVEGEQRRFFQREHRERGQENIAERVGDGTGAMIGERVESLAKPLDESIGG